MIGKIPDVRIDVDESFNATVDVFFNFGGLGQLVLGSQDRQPDDLHERHCHHIIFVFHDQPDKAFARGNFAPGKRRPGKHHDIVFFRKSREVLIRGRI